MNEKTLNQYLLVSTFENLKNNYDEKILKKLLKKKYLKLKISNDNINFYTYSDALIAAFNEASENNRLNLINNVLETTEEYLIREMKKNPPFPDYVMVFLNYLYFDLYFGTEKATMPKKIKFFIRNEKMVEIDSFRNTVINYLGEDSSISYKVNRIAEIIREFDYKSVENFREQLKKIENYIDRIFKNFINLEAYPINFIFKHIYLPYKALVYRVSGNKESKEAENFNFLTNKVYLALTSYPTLYKLLENIKVETTDFSYLKTVNSSLSEYKVENLAQLSKLICQVVIDASYDKLEVEDKQLLYLFYEDVESLIIEYQLLIDYLNS